MKCIQWILLGAALVLPSCVGGNLLEYARDMPGDGTSRVRVSRLGEIERMEVDIDVSRVPGEVKAAAMQELSGQEPDTYFWWASDRDSESAEGFGITAQGGELSVLFSINGARVARHELIEATAIPEDVAPLVTQALEDAGLATAETTAVRHYQGSGQEELRLMLEQNGRRYSLTFNRVDKSWQLYRQVDAMVEVPMTRVEG
ncbi:MAG: hypothetical protein RL885_26835 [Planctomycetota bacterium]